ncbi:AAA family ATPase [Microbacterium sp. A8/3-1]|uniref:AAA family ATPase n=1 Tax=Microbacterium sp. A8/3-1 TaxID=3160749 RepID=A0AAU7VRJ9_9MICO
MTGSWHIDRLRVQNFRQYEALSVDFGSEVTLLIGENGAGKTAVLDAIATLLSTVLADQKHGGKNLRHVDARVVPSDLDYLQRAATIESAYPVIVEGEGELDGATFQWARTIRSPSNRPTLGSRDVREFSSGLINRAVKARELTDAVVLPVIAYYGVERLVGERRAQGDIPVSQRGAYHSALDPRSDLKRLFTFLRNLDNQILRAQAYGDENPLAARRQFEAIEKACELILSPVGWRRMRWNDSINGLTLTHGTHGTLPLSMLATGPRIAAGLAIDLASRMARANPHLGGEDLLCSTPGIVLIDEVDLHLHPSWQQQIVPLLRKTFPRVQFILTTHSPQVISTVEAKNIRILNGTEASTPEFAEGLRSNVVLETLQGVDPAPPTRSRRMLEHYMRLVSAGDGSSVQAVELRQEVERELGGPGLNPELLKADVALAFEGWD